jgi:NAD+ diphosphatase
MNDNYSETLGWDLGIPAQESASDIFILIFCMGKPVYGPHAAWSQTRIAWSDLDDDALFVARKGTAAWYAVSIHSDDLPSGWQTLELRTLAASDSDLYALASRAVQLLRWRDHHRFCGACGGETTGSPSEHVRHCHDCGHTFYPKILPCVIVLVTKGDELLLARSHRHKQTDQFSLIAGFVEVGETLEQAVHREVLEEVGIQVTFPQYQGSQTWPFPGQLMVGFVAEYAGGAICIQEDELVEAGWYAVDQLPKVPNKLSIAGWLIRRFVTSLGKDPEALITGW